MSVLSEAARSEAGPDIKIVASAALRFLLIMAVVSVWPRGQEDVAVVVMPFSSRTHAVHVVSAAGGQLVGAGRVPTIVIARADHIRPEKGFVRRLYASGALFVFDAGIVF